jgi:hypothetical protein
MTMTNMTKTAVKLSETQLVLLSAASQRRTLQVVKHDMVSVQACDRPVKALLKKGLIEEAQLKPGRGSKGFEGEAPHYMITDAGLAAIGVADNPEQAAPEPEVAEPHAVKSSAKRRTKRDLIIALLSRSDGASLDDLVAATGWLPHTTRAALTGLRHRGFTLDRIKGENSRANYRITAGALDPSRVAEAA